MMIRVAHLTKTFGRFAAVDDLSFAVAPGEALAVWGPNGAGKTTVLRCLLGLYRFRGTIEIDGHDVRRNGRAARRAVGYVPQELAFYDDFRSIEALRFFARLKRTPVARASVVLDQVGLSPHAGKRVRELSGGMKQRLALALALLADPPLLLLDELTSNLDAAARAGFLDLLRDLRAAGKTIVFTSHRRDEVRALADRVLMLEEGRLVSDGPPSPADEARADHLVLKVFLAEEQIESAVGVLRRSGFTVSRNGAGLQVVVTANAKAGPIGTLTRAAIDVRDFEVAAHDLAPPPGDRHV